MTIKLGNIHILVVEDIPPMQQLMRDVLLSLGVGTVSLASNGVDAYKLYTRNPPDIIITDWQMPEMDGLQLTQKIRSHKNSINRTIPIIMMTGYCSPARISKSRDIGVTEFMAKPFSSKDIAKRIEHIIKNPRDFIVLPQFVGPDRRRKEKKLSAGQSARKKETTKKIRANNDLKIKAGIGHIDENAIQKSQDVLDNNRINFTPLAKKFLSELDTVIKHAQNFENENDYTQTVKQNLIDPIMQLKANSIVFKYDLVGDLSKIMLDFLESTVEMNEYILEIVQAYHKTTNNIITQESRGKGGDIGKALDKELQNACQRYKNARATLLKDKMRKRG